MAENNKVGIVLSAKDNASATFNEVADSADKLASELRQAATESQPLSPALKNIADELETIAKNQRAIEQFKRLKTEVRDSGPALEKARLETQRLGKELSATSAPSQKLTRDFQEARRRTRELANEQKQNQITLQQLRSELNSYGISTRNINASQNGLNRSFEATSTRAKQLQANLRKSASAAKAAGDSTAVAGQQAQGFGSAIRSLTTRLVAFISVGLGLAKLKQGLTAVFSTGARFESLGTQLEALTGSAQSADEALEWIREFTKNTPAQLDDVANAFTRLKAFGLDPMDGTLQALVDQNEKLGGGQERLNGIIIAVGQAWAKQKLQAEETLQLVERGVPVYDLLSKALGKSTAELEDMSRNGELGRDAIRALIDEIGSSSLGAAAKQMEDTRGIVSNLKDEFVDFLNEIAEQGALEYFKNELRDLGDRIKQMAADGSLQKLARDISDRIIQAGQAVKGFLSLVVSLSMELKTLAAAFIALKFGAMIQGFYGMVTAANAATFSVKNLTRALIRTGWGAIAVGVGYLVSAIWDLNEASAAQTRNAALLAAQQREVSEIYAELSDRVGIQIANSKELIAAEEAGLIVFDEKTRQYERAAAATDDLVDSEADLVEQSEAVKDAVTQEAEAMVNAALAAQQFEARLEELKATKAGLDKQLEKFTAGEFAEFVRQFDDAVALGYLKGAEAIEAQNSIMAESFRRLGVDTETFASGMTTAGSKAVQAFDVIASRADITSNQVRSAFDGALNSVQSRAGLDQLKQRIESLGAAGRLSAKEVNEALDDIKERAQQVDEKLIEARETLQSFGQEINTAETVSQLQNVGIAAAQAWQDGKISAEEYLETMALVDEQKRKLIETTKEQAAAEKEAANASADKAKAETDSAKQVVVARVQATEASKMEAEALARARAAINETDLARTYGIAGLKKYWDAVENLRDRYIKANNEADKLAAGVAKVTANTNTSADSLGNYAQQLETAIRNGDQLNNQSLSRLQSALSEVRSRIQDINSETKSARGELASLQGELASLEGNQRRVQELRYQQRRLELEQKIQEAQAAGNSEAVKSYKSSLNVLSQINKLQVKNISEAEQAEKQQASQSSTAASAPSSNVTPIAQAPTGASPQQTSGRTINLQLSGPNGESATVSATEGETENVISVLRSAGMVTR